MKISSFSGNYALIEADDFDGLVISCSEVLQHRKINITVLIAETINADFSLAAVLVMAFYQAAEELNIDQSEIDNIVGQAEKLSDPARMRDYRQLYDRFMTLEKKLSQAQIYADSYYITSSSATH